MGNTNKKLERIERMIIRLNPSCWKCKTVNLPKGSKCCQHCGENLIRHCISCDKSITGIGKYCYHCGVKQDNVIM